MPSTYPWFIESSLRALITAASSLAYSPVFNPRRTEDTTYGIWTAVLIAFAERTRPFFSKKDRLSLLIIPQYNLYVSPQSDAAADANPDDSNRTEPDAFGKKHGIFTDIAMLRQTVRMLNVPPDVARSTTFLQHMKTFAYDSFFSPENLWVTRDTRVSILVELKPPPTRTPKTIHEFVTNLDYILYAAELQAELQGHVLMCTKRFSQQDSVILIVGAGDWWRCRVWNRANSKDKFDGEFRGEKHLSDSKGLEDGLDWRMAVENDDEIQDEFLDSEAFEDQAIKRKLEDEAEKTRLANGARLKRLLERNVAREKREVAQKDLDKASYPFSISEINLYAHLNLQKENYVVSDNVTIDDNSISTLDWSPTLRLGTTASNKFLERIEKMVQRD